MSPPEGRGGVEGLGGGDRRGGAVPPALSELDAELAAAERRAVSRLDPGFGALVVACAVMLLLVATGLPWTGPTRGWEIMAGGGPGLLPRLFADTAIGFGVLGSASALLTRRWALAWVCALGCAFSVFTGVLAIWSRQTGLGPGTAPGPGPGAGLVLAVLSVLLLAVLWVRLAWSRPAR